MQPLHGHLCSIIIPFYFSHAKIFRNVKGPAAVLTKHRISPLYAAAKAQSTLCTVRYGGMQELYLLGEIYTSSVGGHHPTGTIASNQAPSAED
jgi:hypothetical protein